MYGNIERSLMHRYGISYSVARELAQRGRSNLQRNGKGKKKVIWKDDLQAECKRLYEAEDRQRQRELEITDRFCIEHLPPPRSYSTDEDIMAMAAIPPPMPLRQTTFGSSSSNESFSNSNGYDSDAIVDWRSLNDDHDAHQAGQGVGEAHSAFSSGSESSKKDPLRRIRAFVKREARIQRSSSYDGNPSPRKNRRSGCGSPLPTPQPGLSTPPGCDATSVETSSSKGDDTEVVIALYPVLCRRSRSSLLSDDEKK